MISFRTWLEQQIGGSSDPKKGWKAEKKEIIDAWEKMDPNASFTTLRVIPKGYKGSSLPYDGMRINGSPQFIDTTLAKLKDLLRYENPQTRLSVIYKQQIDTKTQMLRPNSYVAYIQVRQRGATD